jgi:hypothetical protein
MNMKFTSKQILKELRERVSELKIDDRFLSEAELCKEFDISRMTANKINNQLVNEGLLYRVKGSGTYVKSPQVPSQPVRFLLPCPDYFLFDCTYDIRLLMAGILNETKNTEMRIQGVPVSKVNNPQKIDWTELGDFDSETVVIVCGFWFKEVLPFLAERNCKVIFCDFGAGDKADYPEYFSNWKILRLDIHREMAETVLNLKSQGFERIGYVYEDYYQDHPLNTGFNAGLIQAGLDSKSGQTIYAGNIDDYYDAVQNASKNFDVLLLSSSSLVRQSLLILNSSGQKVPDDIALISFGDNQRLSKLNPPVSAVSIPFFEIGANIVKLLKGECSALDKDELKSEMYIRESLKKGAGENINSRCILEPSEEISNKFSFYSS